MAKTKEEIAQVQELAMNAVKDYVKAKQIRRGLVKEQHAGLMVHALVDHGLLADDAETKSTAFFILCKLENASQLRQELEKDGTLGTLATAAEEYC